MAKLQMQFKKGDRQLHYFQLAADGWTAGGTLWFAAKPDIDNDAADSAAVINKSFDDTKIVASDHDQYLAGYVTYELEFDPTDINVTYAAGETSKTFFGEFQYVSSVGDPETFPSNDDYIEVIIYADVKRGVA